MRRLAVLVMMVALAAPAVVATAGRFSFAVVGDNQATGINYLRQPEAFRRIVRELKARKPAFIIQTGDHIWGYQRSGRELKRMWRAYFRAVEPLKPIPIYHTPGNHDLFDETSGKIWDGYFGRRFQAVEYRHNAFILLDGETDVNRISGGQFEWLRERLARYRNWDNIFVAMHKPVFRPGWEGGLYNDDAAQDRHPAEHSRLIDALARAGVKMVFAGHYHMYDMDYRHGILQFLTGGGGGALEPDPVRGFHHYLWIEVDGKKVEVTPVRVSDTDWNDPVVERKAPFVLEDFETDDSPYAWTTWDQSVEGDPVTAPEGRKGRSFRIRYNFSSYEWSLLTLGLEQRERWDGATALSFDAYAPPPAGPNPIPTLTITLRGTGADYGVSGVTLKPGWNRVRLPFNDHVWGRSIGKEKKDKVPLEPPLAGEFTGVTFMLWGYERKDSGEIHLDNVRVE